MDNDINETENSHICIHHFPYQPIKIIREYYPYFLKYAIVISKKKIDIFIPIYHKIHELNQILQITNRPNE